MKIFMLILLALYITPSISISQDEKQNSITQEQIEEIYSSCAKTFRSNYMRNDCIHNKCVELSQDNRCAEKVFEYRDTENPKIEYEVKIYCSPLRSKYS